MTIGDVKNLVDTAFGTSTEILNVIDALYDISSNEKIPPDVRKRLLEQASKLSRETRSLIDGASHTGERLHTLVR